MIHPYFVVQVVICDALGACTSLEVDVDVLEPPSLASNPYDYILLKETSELDIYRLGREVSNGLVLSYSLASLIEQYIVPGFSATLYTDVQKGELLSLVFQSAKELAELSSPLTAATISQVSYFFRAVFCCSCEFSKWNILTFLPLLTRQPALYPKLACNPRPW